MVKASKVAKAVRKPTGRDVRSKEIAEKRAMPAKKLPYICDGSPCYKPPSKCQRVTIADGETAIPDDMFANLTELKTRLCAFRQRSRA